MFYYIYNIKENKPLNSSLSNFPLIFKTEKSAKDACDVYNQTIPIFEVREGRFEVA